MFQNSHQPLKYVILIRNFLSLCDNIKKFDSVKITGIC